MQGDVKQCDPIKINVLFFSMLREQLGKESVSIEMDIKSTGADLLDNLGERFPSLIPFRPVIRLAVNEEYVTEAKIIEDGDEVALITPVSGG